MAERPKGSEWPPPCKKCGGPQTGFTTLFCAKDCERVPKYVPPEKTQPMGVAQSAYNKVVAILTKTQRHVEYKAMGISWCKTCGKRLYGIGGSPYYMDSGGSEWCP